MSNEVFGKGTVCDSWMSMSSNVLDMICRKLYFDRAYSFERRASKAQINL